jgi:hypothetical protein
VTDPTSKVCIATILKILKEEILKEYSERETGMYFHLFYIWDPTIPFNPYCVHLNGLFPHIRWVFSHASWLHLPAICSDIKGENLKDRFQ